MKCLVFCEWRSNFVFVYAQTKLRSSLVLPHFIMVSDWPCLRLVIGGIVRIQVGEEPSSSYGCQVKFQMSGAVLLFLFLFFPQYQTIKAAMTKILAVVLKYIKAFRLPLKAITKVTRFSKKSTLPLFMGASLTYFWATSWTETRETN